MGQDPRAYQSTVRLRVIFTNKIWGVGRKEREKSAEQQRNARVLPARTRVDVRNIFMKRHYIHATNSSSKKTSAHSCRLPKKHWTLLAETRTTT